MTCLTAVGAHIYNFNIEFTKDVRKKIVLTSLSFA